MLEGSAMKHRFAVFAFAAFLGLLSGCKEEEASVPGSGAPAVTQDPPATPTPLPLPAGSALLITSHSEGAVLEERSITLEGACDAASAVSAAGGPGVEIDGATCVGGALSVSVRFVTGAVSAARSVTVTQVDGGGNAQAVTRGFLLKEPLGFIENTYGTGVNNVVRAAALQGGKLFVAGAFTAGRFARFNADGSPDTDYNAALGSGANGEVSAVAVLPDGAVILGGSFTLFNGVTVPRLVKLTPVGAVDGAFVTSLGSGPSGGTMAVQAIVVQPDGKFIVAGPFQKWSGFPAGASSGIHRFSAAGVRDGGFAHAGSLAPASGNSFTLALQSDGRVLVGGRRDTSVNGLATGGFFRLTSAGGLDQAEGFAAGADRHLLEAGRFVRHIFLDGAGHIYLGGDFTQWGDEGGVARGSSRLVRLREADGVFDGDFTTALGTAFNGAVLSIAQQDDGKLVLGGAFTAFNGASAGRIVRLNADLSVDGLFTANLMPQVASTGFNGSVTTLIPDGSGRLIVAGAFNKLNNLAMGRLLRLY